MSAPIQDMHGTSLRPEIVEIAREVERAVLDNGYRLTMMYGATNFPDHNNGRCVDFMTSSAERLDGRKLSLDEQHELGDWIADYIWQHRGRFRVNWQIWWKHIRRTWSGNHSTKPVNVWDRYTGPKPHTDHVHAEFAAGSYQAPRKQEDELPSVEDVWRTDDIVEAPGEPQEGNKFWTPSSYLRKTYETLIEVKNLLVEVKTLLQAASSNANK